MNKNNGIFLLLIFFLSMIFGVLCGYQVLGESRDYFSYVEFFEISRVSSSFFDVKYRFEPIFTLVVYSLTHIGMSDAFVYSVIVFFSFFIKYYSLSGCNKYWLAFIVFTVYYLSRYFLLFEMTVLRAAFALSLAFYVFYRKQDDKFYLKDFLILLIAVGFHYSAIVFLFIYFLKPNKISGVFIYSLLVFIIIVVLKAFAIVWLSDSIPGFSAYRDQASATAFPIPMLFDLFLFSIAIFMFKSSDFAMRYALMGLGISFAFHFALIEYVVFANRFRELLSVFILIYVIRSIIGKNKMMKLISGGYVVVTSIIYLYGYLIFDPLLL